MPRQAIRSILTLFVIALVSPIVALAQSPTSSRAPAITAINTWQVAQLVGSSKGKLFVVTIDQPHRRQIATSSHLPWTSSSAPASSAVLASTYRGARFPLLRRSNLAELRMASNKSTSG
jgi:hypothetical protein